MHRLRPYAVVLLGLGPLVMGSGWGAGGCGSGGAYGSADGAASVRLQPDAVVESTVRVTYEGVGDASIDTSLWVGISAPAMIGEQLAASIVEGGVESVARTDEIVGTDRGFSIAMNADHEVCKGTCTRDYVIRLELASPADAVDATLSFSASSSCDDCDDDVALPISIVTE
ncbi:MAG: hypothetical protein RMA76_18440 [Deltaproteobacteria bacterium]|jgi:hypothetical protein